MACVNAQHHLTGLQQNQPSSKKELEQILANAEFKKALATAAKVYNWTPAETSLVEKTLRERNWTAEEITELQNALREKKLTSQFFANRPNPVQKSQRPSIAHGGGANLYQTEYCARGVNFSPIGWMGFPTPSVEVDIHIKCSIM